MKKIFLIDSIMLLASLILLAIFAPGIHDTGILCIFALFITLSLYVSVKMSILLRFTPKSPLSWAEKLFAFALILGKLDFLVMVLRFGYFKSTMNDSVMLFLFMAYTLGVLLYAYTTDTHLIILSRGAYAYEDLTEATVKESFGQYHFCMSTKDNKKIYFRLSSPEYALYRKAK